MDYNIGDIPDVLPILEEVCANVGFTMPSDREVGSLLRTLCLSKPSGQFLELGTGIGLSLAWIIDGSIRESHITSIDNDPELISIVKTYFDEEEHVEILCEDAGTWIEKNSKKSFDLIFADAWPGKYSHTDEILEMVAQGGFYIVDDMNEQKNWPDGHAMNVENLVKTLSMRDDFKVVKLNWSTGILLCV